MPELIVRKWDGPYSFMIFREEGLYKARRGDNGSIQFEDPELHEVLNDVWNAMTPGRTWVETVVMKGNLELNSTITLRANTHLKVLGKLKASSTITDADLILIEDGAENVVIDGGGVIEASTSLMGGLIADSGGSPSDVKNIMIKNLYLKPHFYGVYLDCEKAVIENNVIKHIATGLDIGASIKGRRLRNSVIKGNLIIDSPPDGGIMDTAPVSYESYGNVVEGNIIICDVQGGFGIDVTGSRNKTIKNNIVSYGQIGWEPANNATDIIIEGNVIVDPSDHGIHTPDGYDIVIANNRVIFSTPSSTYHGIMASVGSKYTIKGNRIVNAYYGIYTGGGSDYIIEGNYVEGSYSTGIAVSSDNTVVANNIVKNSNQGSVAGVRNQVGIAIAYAGSVSNVSVIGNRIFDDQAVKTQQYALMLGSGGGARVPSYVRVSLNDLLGNAVGGIYIDNLGTGCIIERNFGYTTENSGTETGTGAQQAIAHGCDFTPTKAQVIVSNIDDGANPYLSADPDATNIYVTAVSGKAYRWEVKRNP